MSFLAKAADFILGILAENEEAKQFSKDFVTASVQWVGSWFLKDDPTSEKILKNPAKSAATKKDIIETKLEELQNNPQFMKELDERLQALEQERKRIKNVVSGSEIEAEGNVHIGDKGAQGGEDYDEKNVVKGSTIKAGGDFRLGDDVIQGNQQVNITHHHYQGNVPSSPGANPPAPTSVKARAQKLVAEGKTGQALELLIDTPTLDSTDQNTVFLLSGRQNALDRKIRNGSISEENAQLEQNKINDAVLSLLK